MQLRGQREARHDARRKLERCRTESLNLWTSPAITHSLERVAERVPLLTSELIMLLRRSITLHETRQRTLDHDLVPYSEVSMKEPHVAVHQALRRRALSRQIMDRRITRQPEPPQQRTPQALGCSPQQLENRRELDPRETNPREGL